MEIKHTIEILTKDIQDIEKLVRNLNNNPVPSSIELDLALSKLRHVYELLLMIRKDSMAELDLTALFEEEDKAQKEAREQEAREQEAREQAAREQAAREQAARDSKPLQEEEQNQRPENGGSEGAAKKKDKEAAILGEKFKKEQSLNERITGSHPSDISSKLSGKPIDNIARHIGINDRFQIIRELLNGDSEAFADLILHLDSADNFNDAFHTLEERFPDELENESVQLLVNLARRRFISQGNV
jgi:hypothetical protein